MILFLFLGLDLDVESEPSNLDEIKASSCLSNAKQQESNDNCDTNSLGSWKDVAENNADQEASTSGGLAFKSPTVETPSPRMSWADMAQEDELEEEEEEHRDTNNVDDISDSVEDLRISNVVEKSELSREQREYIRFMNVKRKKDFICLEKVRGKIVNILDGLELHTGVFSTAEQNRIVSYVYDLQEKGKKGELKG